MAKEEMLKRARKIHERLSRNPDVASRLLVAYTRPLGSGTRGVVYATTYPNIVVKLSTDEREPVAATRLQRLAMRHVVRVFASFSKEIDGKKIVFTYLERMTPLSKLRVAAQTHLHENYSFSYHKPRTVLAALQSAIEGGKAPLEFRPHLLEYRALLNELLDAGEWHRDLKAPNLMIDRKGRLCVTDIGSFTDRPLLVTRNPPLVSQELFELADKITKSGWPSEANAVRKLAMTSFKGMDPRGTLGPPDPNRAAPKKIKKLKVTHLPEEMLHDTAPNGANWRKPNRGADRRRETRRTVDVTIDRSKMNGQPGNRNPRHPR